MTPTPVGMRCPECSQEKTRVVSGSVTAGGGFPATKVLIGLCLVAYLLEIASVAAGPPKYAMPTSMPPIIPSR